MTSGLDKRVGSLGENSSYEWLSKRGQAIYLLTRLLWREWHGVDHLLQWSSWRRRHQFHALRCYYMKRGSPLPIFYLQPSY